MTLDELLAARGLTGRIGALGDVLDRGAPAASAAELDAVVAELEGEDVDEPELRAAVERAAIAARLARDDYGALMAAIDERAAPGWGDQPEGQMYLQALAAGLAPLAGLDVDATRASARTFLANFPAVSLPFGDVDERAANWLARLHDSRAVREALRDLLAGAGDAWAERHPLAAEQARRWGSRPAPDDPTADGPWMRALVALVRAEL